MDSQYGIVIKNKYDLFLGDEEDPSDVVIPIKEEKKQVNIENKKNVKNEKSKLNKNKSNERTGSILQEKKQQNANTNTNKREGIFSTVIVIFRQHV